MSNTKRNTIAPRARLAAGALLLVTACGTAVPEEHDPLADATRNGQGAGKDAGGKDGPGAVKELKFTVPKQNDSVDVVFIVDVDSVLRNGPEGNLVRRRFEQAMEGFNARVKFKQGDVTYRVGPASVPDLDRNGEPIEARTMDKGYGFWRDANDGNEALKHDFADFQKEFSRRLFQADDETYSYKPIAALRRVVSGSPDSALRGKAGKAFTSIVLINSRADRGDETPFTDVLSTFDQNLKGGWALSVIGLPENGCDLGDEKRTMIGQPKLADGKDSNQRYRSFQLAKTAGAKARFVSICETDFESFFQDLAASPAGSQNSVVELGAKAVAKSIEVRSDKGLVTGWKYVSGETKLTLPSFVKPGTKLSIRFVVHDGKSANPLPAAMAAPPLVEKKLSPEELEFLQKAAPQIRNQCGNCHGPGSGRTVYVDNFANVIMRKDTIKTRLSLPAADAMRMPPGGGDQNQVNQIIQYLDSVQM